MLKGKRRVRQRLLYGILYLLYRLLQLHLTQGCSRILHLGSRRLLALLRVNCFQHFGHQLHFGLRHDREYILVEMDHVTLVFCLREYLSHNLLHTQTLVADNEPDIIKIATTQLLKEADPTGPVLLYALCRTQNLTVAVLIDRKYYQKADVFVLSTPVPLEVDTIYIDAQIPSALQRTVPPVLDV